MDLIIETAGETEEESDVLQLVVENWLDLGVKAYVKPLQRQVLRNRIFAGDTLMALWFGLENGIPSADMSPQEFAPTSQQQYQWPKWGQHFETRGQAGQPPDLPEAKRLLELFEAWRAAPTTDERREIWRQILEIYSDQVYTIGIIAGVPQPVVADQDLQQSAQRRDLQLGARRPVRHLPPGHFLVRGRRGRRSASMSAERSAAAERGMLVTPTRALRTGTDAVGDRPQRGRLGYG